MVLSLWMDSILDYNLCTPRLNCANHNKLIESNQKESSGPQGIGIWVPLFSWSAHYRSDASQLLLLGWAGSPWAICGVRPGCGHPATSGFLLLPSDSTGGDKLRDLHQASRKAWGRALAACSWG